MESASRWLILAPSGRRAGLLFAALPVLLAAGSARGFSQKGAVGGVATPEGHEYLTVQSAKAVALEAGFESLKEPTLTNGLPEVNAARAKCVTCDTYGTKNWYVWSAVMGQRWVDLMGYDVKSVAAQAVGVKGITCWDAVAQMGDLVQWDHFLRRNMGPQDEGEKGRTLTYHGALFRLRAYFIAAATANSTDRIPFTDGGASTGNYVASKRFFLFGRAVHLFQDSFSPEHAVRDWLKTGGKAPILDIKSYLGTKGAQQHTHVAPKKGGTNRDAIFDSDGTLRNPARIAKIATEDLWRAFHRTVFNGKNANKELDTVIKKWMQLGPYPGSHTLTGEEVAQGKKLPSPVEIMHKREKCMKEFKSPPIDGRAPYKW